MTHPFALSIDDLACLELVETEPPVGGVGILKLGGFHPTPGKPLEPGPGGCILTIGYNHENGSHPAIM
jgi:hypothetical protein